jgi:predicted CoA-binding protein
MSNEEDILRSCKVIAVVGLSSEPGRASYGVAKYLQGQGYHIIPVNPRETTILNETCYPDLSTIPVPVDMVDVFRRSEAVPEIVDEAIKIGAKAIWLQEGIVHEEAAARARKAGLKVVMDKCAFKEHLKMVNPDYAD